jgi:hypothetical protein
VAEVLVECLGDQARQRNGAAPGGGLGLGSVAAHLGGGFDHLQSVVRQVMGLSGPGGPLPVSEARLWRWEHPAPAAAQSTRWPTGPTGSEQVVPSASAARAMTATASGRAEARPDRRAVPPPSPRSEERRCHCRRLVGARHGDVWHVRCVSDAAVLITPSDEAEPLPDRNPPEIRALQFPVASDEIER